MCVETYPLEIFELSMHALIMKSKIKLLNCVFTGVFQSQPRGQMDITLLAIEWRDDHT